MVLQVVERNVLANFAARVWAGVISILLIPVYIRYLGVEAYGLVGVFVSLQALLLLLDLGLGATVSREFARFAGTRDRAAYLLDLLRTLEVLYWAMALLIALLVLALSGPIARHWLSPETLTADSVATTVGLIGITIAAQWPTALYSGGLAGLQRQVRLSTLISGFATLRYLGAVAVLHFISPTIEAFFCWQLLVAVLQTPTLRFNLLRVCPAAPRPGALRLQAVLPLWRFATAMLGITMAGTVITQLDKVVLSRALSLQDFGYYSIATAAAGSLYMAVGPVFNAFYPRFAALFEARDRAAIRADFHQGNQILAVVLFPVMWLVVFHADDVMLLWTGDPQLATRVGQLLVPLVAGNTINGLMNMPYALQLGAGWTRIPLVTNLAGLAFLLPALLYGTIHHGALGAAMAWLLFNLVYLAITVVIMRRVALHEATAHWLLRDIGLPMATSLAVFGGSELLFSAPLSLPQGMLLTAFAVACTITSAPRVRSMVRTALG